MNERIPTSEMVLLRRRAEQRIGPRDGARSRLAYELELLQVQLELQHQELRRLREELRISRQQCEDLFEGSPIAYVALDAFGRLTAVNRRFCQLLALHRAEVIGTMFPGLTSEDGADRLQAALDEAHDRGIAQEEIPIVRGDGHVMHVRLDIVADERSFRIAVQPCE